MFMVEKSLEACSAASMTRKVETAAAAANSETRLLIPASKATPSSISRETIPQLNGIKRGSSLSPKMLADLPPAPHVPHEPYKGAVWSKPVRIRGKGSASAQSSKQSSRQASRPPSRASSQANTCENHVPVKNSISNSTLIQGPDPFGETQSAFAGLISKQQDLNIDILTRDLMKLKKLEMGINGAATSTYIPKEISLAGQKLEPQNKTTSPVQTTTNQETNQISPSQEKPVSVVVPVKSPSVGCSRSHSHVASGEHHHSDSHSVDGFAGSTIQALQSEILRLREDNRRLHAMRRTSHPAFSTEFPANHVEGLLGDSTVEGLTEENWKLKESVKRLSGQLQAQAQVNQDLKKLVIASIGDDLQYRFESISSSRAQLDQEASHLLKSLSETKEELDKVAIQCDVWKSKFMASRLMVDELASWKASLHMKHMDIQRALRLMMEEQSQVHRLLTVTNKNLAQLSQSLRSRYPALSTEPTIKKASSKTKNPVGENRNLIEIGEDNKRIAQLLNVEIETLIKAASDATSCDPSRSASRSASGSSSPLLSPRSASPHSTKVALTPAASLAQEVLLSTNISSSSVSNDAIAYLDRILSSQDQIPFEFTFKCCENCNGDIQSL